MIGVVMAILVVGLLAFEWWWLSDAADRRDRQSQFTEHKMGEEE